MTISRIIQIILVGFTFIAGCNNPKENHTESSVDSRIVLVNIKDANRLQIANALDRLKSCSTKIIAINAIFENKMDPKYDSVFSNAIKISGNVILPFVEGDGELVQSDSLFRTICLGQGAVEMWPVDEVINTFKTVIYSNEKEELAWTFPFAIVNYFDIGNQSYLKQTKPNKQYYIKFNQSNEVGSGYEGISLDCLSSLNCDTFRNKIVLMGDIIQDDRDGYLISSDSKVRFSSTIIFAAIITTILNQDFSELQD